MSSRLVYDGLEFRERATMDLYVSLKRRFSITSFVSMAAMAPAFALLLFSFVEPGKEPSYLYLVFLAVSIPFSILSFATNSKLTEIINSNDVRHVGF